MISIIIIVEVNQYNFYLRYKVVFHINYFNNNYFYNIESIFYIEKVMIKFYKIYK